MAYFPTGNELIDPFKLLEASGIREGMEVADFGCGTLGHYVFPAARLVGPSGKVYAIDILKSVLNGIESRMKMENAGNVTPLWGDLEREHGIKLADASIDLGLLINNLFMSQQKAVLVKECVRMIKPGGALLIVDWKPSASAIGPDPAVRVTADEAKALGLAAGLKLEKEIVPGEQHYGFLFRK